MEERRRDHIINLYLKTIESLNASIRQTVVSIWSATVLYIAIYWTFTSFSYNQENLFCPIISIIIITGSLLLTYLFVIFIFTQFSGWISKLSHIHALSIGIHKLAIYNEKVSEDGLKLSNKKYIPKFLVNDYNEYSTRLYNLGDQQKEKKWWRSRPIKEICFFITFCWQSRLSHNRDRQEGIIYCFFLFFWIIFVILFIDKHLINKL